MKSFWNRLNTYFKRHPYQEVLLPALVGSILGITIEFLLHGDFLVENIWLVLFINLFLLYQAYRKQKKIKAKKK